MSKNSSKEKVLDAAKQLFFQKGFHGTSVRDIANKANVNVSLISYYFKSKQGLLEYAVMFYYEAYLEVIEQVFEKTKKENALTRLKLFVKAIIEYKQKNYQFSCFIHRELSLDSVFVREMAVTYLAKENYYLKEALFAILSHSNQYIKKDFLLIHLKGMLTTPYILQNEWRDKVIGRASHKAFQNNYIETIHIWLDFLAEDSLDYHQSDFSKSILT